MKHFYKHKEIPTIHDGVFLKIEATPKDARDDDVSNNFFIGYLIDRRENTKHGSAVYSAGLRTFPAEQVRDLLDIKSRERVYWD